MNKVLIAGGGAAGMMAAVMAAREGCAVTLFEKNEKLGKKVFITGKGRCNLTNACDVEDLFPAVKTNAKFLYSSFYGFTNQDVMDFFPSDNTTPVKCPSFASIFFTDVFRQIFTPSLFISSSKVRITSEE